MRQSFQTYKATVEKSEVERTAKAPKKEKGPVKLDGMDELFG